MYYLLSVLTGALIASMLVINGALSARYGVYLSTILIHVVGLLFILAVLLIKREPLRRGVRLPPAYYLGGAIGVATVVFNNIAFVHLGVSAILALGLLGQSVTALIIDQYGLFSMPKRRFQKRKLIGLSLIVFGIVLMLTL